MYAQKQVPRSLGARPLPDTCHKHRDGATTQLEGAESGLSNVPTRCSSMVLHGGRLLLIVTSMGHMGVT